MFAAKTKQIIKPRPLKAGDTIGLVCPSSRPQTPAVVARCQRLVTEMGFKPLVGKNVLNTHGFMAGADHERLADLHSFLGDDSVAGIFCITGGYGSLHLLQHLDYDRIATSAKLIVGGDDATCLLNGIHARTGLVTMHGPNLEQIKERDTFERFKQAVTSSAALPALVAFDATDATHDDEFYCAVEGNAQGRLVGGNLTALASLAGTPYEPDMSGRILFLEDINEQSGILDRWFTTLYLAGHLQYAHAVCFGSFQNCGAKDSASMLSVMDLFADRLKYLGKTSCFGMPFGQQLRTGIVPIGVNASLDAAAGRLEFLEPACG